MMHVEHKKAEDDETLTIKFSNIEDHAILPSLANLIEEDKKYESCKTKLIIQNCHLCSDEYQAIIKITKSLKKIDELVLINNQLSGNELIEIINSIQNNFLRSFVLSDTWIDEKYTEKVIDLLLKYNISMLDLSLDWLHTNGVIFLLESLEKNNTIQSLNISCDDFRMDALKPLLSNTKLQLKYLDVSYNLIDEHGMEYLANFIEKNAHLEVLNLNSNKIGDYGANILADTLGNNDKLKTLNIADNGIGMEGYVRLLNSLSTHNNIEKLVFSNNNLNKKLMEDLAAVYNIKDRFEIVTF